MATTTPNPPPLVHDDAALTALLELLYAQFHYDFRRYARASLHRRLVLACDRLRCATLGELGQRVTDEPQAFAALLSFFTIQVSELFRDPSYFRAFRQEVVPVLRTYPSRTLWVAGCSTGEEAYSLAIVLREEGLLERSRIYATDIYPESLRIAEAGIYALDRLRGFTDNHARSGAPGSLAAHYATAPQGGAIFDRELRDHIVFADHSLATDTVFAEVQVVSCRNVFIYFDRTLQDRALGVFRSALSRRGFLGLGPKETLQFSAHAHAFERFAAPERWYRLQDAA